MKYTLIFTVLTLLLLGCKQELEPIAYGYDSCHWCQMRIMDPKFGAEAVTDKGRTYKFDSAECLLHYLQESPVSHSHLAVTDFESPESLIDAKAAWFLVSPEMPSPMGAFLNAFSTESAATDQQFAHGGEIFHWESLQQHFAK